MQSLVGPIERVVESAEWFVRTPSLRVLHVTTTALLRLPVLQHLTATELLEVNDAPFFVLEAPTEPGDDGWALRCEELRADWQSLSESSPDTLPMAPLWPVCGAPTPLARFAQELSQALRVLRPPMGGLVIVLAPVWVREPQRWSDDLRALLGEPGLRAARFVVVELETAASLPALEALGAAVERVDARVDDRAVRDEMNARLDAMRAAPAGATGPQLVGAAGPSAPAPARRDQVKPLGPRRGRRGRARSASPKRCSTPTRCSACGCWCCRRRWRCAMGSWSRGWSCNGRRGTSASSTGC
ncbi:MAG: hypothetical protein IPF99_35370 [Deltaproteobacteria bacterium]|nr:hypothetical protein [Deltaproteobacteria bacterium]